MIYLLNKKISIQLVLIFKIIFLKLAMNLKSKVIELIALFCLTLGASSGQ